MWGRLLSSQGFCIAFYRHYLRRKNFLTIIPPEPSHNARISFEQCLLYTLASRREFIVFKQSPLRTPTNCLLSIFVAAVGGSEITFGNGFTTAGPCLFHIRYLMRGRVSTFQDICIRSYVYHFMRKHSAPPIQQQRSNYIVLLANRYYTLWLLSCTWRFCHRWPPHTFLIILYMIII